MKIVGWILIVLSVMNFLNIPFRLQNGEPLESPFFYLILTGMLIAGIYFVNKEGDKKSKDLTEKD